MFKSKFIVKSLVVAILFTSINLSDCVMAKTTIVNDKENIFQQLTCNLGEGLYVCDNNDVRTRELDDKKELLISIKGNATNNQIKEAVEGIADDYKIISGKFSIDEDLPKEKRDRLSKYLNLGNYNTIVSLDVKNNVNLSTAKKRLENKANICEVDYNSSTNEIDSYGVDDTYSSNQYHLSKINAKTAWNTYSKSGYKEVYVAVIDTGLYTSNKDFSGVYLKNYSVDIRNKVNGAYKKLSDISKPDLSGHGTHVAGIVASKGNNAFSTVGVGSGWINDCCKIMAIKADYRDLDENGKEQSYYYNSDLIEAIQYAIAHGAEVINMSLGGYNNYNSTFQAVIDNAYNAGVTIVASKGNNNRDTTVNQYKHFPSDYNHVISVSATDENNKKVNFSNYGNVDIAAPGNNIYSSARSTKDTYVVMFGTSMATPMVSATVALIKGINYDLTNAQVEEVLLSTTKNIGSATYFGKGLVDTGYAVQKAKYLGLKNQTLNLKSVTQTNAGNVKIKWSDLYYAEGYCVYRSTSKNGTYKKIANVDEDEYYIDKNVKKSKTYYYKVRGYMYYDHGPGTVHGKNAGHSKYSTVKAVKVTK